MCCELSGLEGSKDWRVPWRIVTLLVCSAIPFHRRWPRSRPVSGIIVLLACPQTRASWTKPSTGSTRTTSATRWRRTSAVTRPMPAPTSRALIRGRGCGGARGLMEDGTVLSSGRRWRRKRREPRASTLGRDLTAFVSKFLDKNE